MHTENHPIRIFLIAAIAMVVAIALTGCATTPQSGFNSNIPAQAAVAAAIDVAVGAAVQKGIQPAFLAEGAKELKAYDSGQAVTIPALNAEIQVLMQKYQLNPGQVAAVQVLVATTNALIQAQVRAPSSAPAAISADILTTLNIVLDDVISAASIYAPAVGVPTTDIPQQNKHFVLASVETPEVVGGSVSLLLVLSLNAFAHIAISPPAAAAITVLATAGAALIDNLAT